MARRLPPQAELSVGEMDAAISELLPSQKVFLGSPETSKAIEGGWACLGADTLILTPSGSRRIEEISAGEIVYALDGTPTKVVARLNNGVKKLWRWFGKRGQQILSFDATEDHKVWSTQEQHGYCKEPSLLRLGVLKNRAYFVRQEGVSLGEQDYPLALLLGLLLGDGYLGANTPQWTCAEPELVSFVKTYLAPFNYDIRSSGIQHYIRDPQAVNIGPSPRHRLKIELARLGLLGLKSKEKFIPKEVWNWKKEDAAALLAGLIASDGSVYQNQGKWTMGFSSISRGMIEDFKRLLAEGFGVYGGSVSPDGRGCFGITYSTKENFERLLSIPVPGRKGRAIQQAVSDFKYVSHASRVHLADREYLGEQPTFDLHVEHPSHIFLLKNLVPVANSGKSTVCFIHACLLSAKFPGSIGLVGRKNYVDLETYTIPGFLAVLPPSWIKSHRRSAPQSITLRNESIIQFQHIGESRATAGMKTRQPGANLAWVVLDQAEELTQEDYSKMLGRLRSAKATKRFLLLNANPNGHDWIYKTFFEGVDNEPWRADEFYRKVTGENRLGVAVRSEENRKSNGGFVDDEFFEKLRREMTAEWIARYVDCSFAEFTGKVYKEYRLDSVHNIRRFPFPEHWPTWCSIDVGGSVPWSVALHKVDDLGNVITYDELHRAEITTGEVAAWIKARCDYRNTRFVIDYENRVVMVELQQDHGIACQPAIKNVQPGIQRMLGRIHLDPQHPKPLPDWYRETQDLQQYNKFREAGSPGWFICYECGDARVEMNGYLWGDDGKPRKENDHFPDGLRYLVMALPRPGKARAVNSKREELRKIDPAAAAEHDAMDRRIKAIQDAQRHGPWREEAAEEIGERRVGAVSLVRGMDELDADEVNVGGGFGYDKIEMV